MNLTTREADAVRRAIAERDSRAARVVAERVDPLTASDVVRSAASAARHGRETLATGLYHLAGTMMREGGAAGW